MLTCTYASMHASNNCKLKLILTVVATNSYWCSAALEEQLATAHEQSAHQRSQLADTQASHTSQTQALQQQLSVQQGETKTALQQLEGAKQTVVQLQAACQQQSERNAELEANLAASQGTVASANAELASQTGRTAGTAATHAYACRCHMHVDAICNVLRNAVSTAT